MKRFLIVMRGEEGSQHSPVGEGVAVSEHNAKDYEHAMQLLAEDYGWEPETWEKDMDYYGGDLEIQIYEISGGDNGRTFRDFGVTMTEAEIVLAEEELKKAELEQLKHLAAKHGKALV